jgi:bla regulator protein BlaR1
MKTEWISGLVHASIGLTLALVAVLCLRTLLRRQFSALHGYALWALVPSLPLASIVPLLLPRAVLPLPVLRMMMASVKAAAPMGEMPSNIDVATAMIDVWIAGTIFSFTLQCWRQMQFMRSLGQVERVDNIYRAQARDIGPALVGILRPKIIVPFDFFTRYTEVEQQLILAHENIHWQRGDSLTNALCSLLQCVFWFHPLIHLGAVRFRVDQELACDALVLRHHRNARKTYASTILKTQTQHLLLPVACTWQSNYFLKERIMQLNQRTPRSLKRHIGSGLLFTLIGMGACATWAAQSTPATPAAEQKMVDIAMTTIIDDGKANSMKIRAPLNVPFAVKEGVLGDKWEGTYTVSVKKNNVLNLEASVTHRDEVVAHPSVQFHVGETAKVTTNDAKSKYAVSLIVQPGASLDSDTTASEKAEAPEK